MTQTQTQTWFSSGDSQTPDRQAKLRNYEKPFCKTKLGPKTNKATTSQRLMKKVRRVKLREKRDKL